MIIFKVVSLIVVSVTLSVVSVALTIKGMQNWFDRRAATSK